MFEFKNNIKLAIFSINVVRLPTDTDHRTRAGNDVIDILTPDDMENTPLRSRMKFRINFTVFTSGVFYSKTLASI